MAATGPVTVEDVAMANQTYGALQVNKSVSGKALTIAGKTYESGLGAHAVSEFPVTVPPGAVRLSGAVGVDDAAGKGNGSVKFRILSGDAVLWESPELKSGDAAVSFDIVVPSALHRKLYLQADDLGNNSYDHADWVDLKWQYGSMDKPKAGQVFEGKSFGIRPDSRDDQTTALCKALKALREAPGSTLKLAQGTYHFWYTGALRRHFHISNHDQPTWHPVGIPLVDLHDVIIDGQGSTFVFHGKMLPVLIQDSEKVILRNVSIDFERPHHSQAIITKIEPGTFEMTVDQKQYPHEIRNGWIVHKGEGWEAGDWGHGIVFDGTTREVVAETGDFGYRGKLTVLSDGHYRVEKDISKTKVKIGDRITMRHSSRPHPGICIYRAKDTVLEQVNIHQAAGMAILGQRSENIRISGGGINLAKGTDRYFTNNADATHFSNCRGAIMCENGLYEAMMDDAINVHATCLRIEETVDNRTLKARYVHGQSVGFEVVLPGESLRFIHARHLELTPPVKVKSIRRINTENVEITLESDIPAGIGKGDALEDADWFPSVVFRGNTVRNNRARGTLFTTPEPVLVENNNFDHSSGSAILLAGDSNGWYESGACADVLIRKNIFRANLTSRYQFTEGIISIYPEIPDLKEKKGYYHRNVRIEDNAFYTSDVPLVFAISTDGLAFRNNKVVYDNHYRSWKKEPFIFRHCANILIEKNEVSNSHSGPWTEKSVKREMTPEGAVVIR
ncbi:MAG: NPCBM/NEW2 domain-containing protein [Puniceicoccales bacterium]|nr:NPCBM/NEW2 domain-containing protein [Puniceicoccales bacterium]